jgi:predicted metalloendopeptidase
MSVPDDQGIMDEEASTDEHLIPDMDEDDDPMYGEHTQGSIVQQLVWAKGKYKRAKKASFVLLSFSSLLLVLILFFAYVAYTGGGLLSGADDNPYLSDGNQTVSWMNTEIDPCVDFASYAVQGWVDGITLSKGSKQESLTFGTARKNMRKTLDTIVNADWPYLRPFHDSCLATPSSIASPTTRMAPLSNWVLKFSAAKEATELIIIMAQLRWNAGIDLAFPFSVSPTVDPKNSSRYLVGVQQNGFLLPAKAYYTEEATVNFYRGWIQQMFAQVGLTLDIGKVNDMIAMESILAANSQDMEDQYDPYLTYNPIDRTPLNLMLGGVLYSYFTALNLTNLPTTLDDLHYFQQIMYIVTDGQLVALKNLLLLRLFYRTFPYIDDQSRSLKNALTIQLQGMETVTKQEYCVDLTVTYLGMLVSHYYVVQYFDEANRNSTAVMMSAMIDRYKVFISSWSWMDTITKAKALEKYDKLTIMLAYPSQWPNFDKLLTGLQLSPLSSTSVLSNVLKLSLAYDRFQMAGLRNPVDLLQWGRTGLKLPVGFGDWQMDPIEVNAYYDPTRNGIVIPAAIMDVPFFSARTLPYAARLAKLGAVLGHELWHTIDKSGSEYDASGNLQNWQSDTARAGFAVRVDCIAEQYSAMTVDNSHMLNGDLVVAEAMADLNGLLQAYETLTDFVDRGDDESDLEDKLVRDAYNDLTPQQVFFVKFAQLWTAVTSPAYELALSRTDPHPSARDRLVGTLRNMQGFADAFDCPVGSAMNPEAKCSMR